MKLYNFKKETSERSDATNWAKHMLIEQTDFFFDGIEGCNQNAQNQTTHLFERAHVDIDLNGPKSKERVLNSIIELESKPALQRKINFGLAFGLPLSYVLHNDTKGLVFVLEFRNTDDVEFAKSFSSYEAFGEYLAEIKGWKSGKSFREYDDLPMIDKSLRKNGTPWPTNIDCFCSDKNNNPIAIIEYQNAKQIGVLKHSNNEYFLCKQKSVKNSDYGPKTIYHDDIRRWTSQEILRVQSGLPLFVITWSQNEAHFQLKEVDQIVFPDFEMNNPKDRWKRMATYKELLHQYATTKSDKSMTDVSRMKTLFLQKENNQIVENSNTLPTSIKGKTFPHIYWNRKAVVSDGRESLGVLFGAWVSR